MSYNERSLRGSLGCGAIWVARLKMMSRITQSFILSFMYLMVSWYLEVIDKLTHNILFATIIKKNVKMLGNKINVVVKTHPSFFDEFSRKFFFQFVKIHCRDAGTDFCQARPIVVRPLKMIGYGLWISSLSNLAKTLQTVCEPAFFSFYFGAKFRRVDRGNAWSQDFLKLAFISLFSSI